MFCRTPNYNNNTNNNNNDDDVDDVDNNNNNDNNNDDDDDDDDDNSHLERIVIKPQVSTLQKSALFGTANLLRKELCLRSNEVEESSKT